MVKKKYGNHFFVVYEKTRGSFKIILTEYTNKITTWEVYVHIPGNRMKMEHGSADNLDLACAEADDYINDIIKGAT